MLDNGVDMTFVIFLSLEELGKKKHILFRTKSEAFILLHNI